MSIYFHFYFLNSESFECRTLLVYSISVSKSYKDATFFESNGNISPQAALFCPSLVSHPVQFISGGRNETNQWNKQTNKQKNWSSPLISCRELKLVWVAGRRIWVLLSLVASEKQPLASFPLFSCFSPLLPWSVMIGWFFYVQWWRSRDTSREAEKRESDREMAAAPPHSFAFSYWRSSTYECYICIITVIELHLYYQFSVKLVF